MEEVKVGVFNLVEATVEGRIVNFDGYDYEIEIDVGSLRARFSVNADRLENEHPQRGDMVLLRLK